MNPEDQMRALRTLLHYLNGYKTEIINVCADLDIVGRDMNLRYDPSISLMTEIECLESKIDHYYRRIQQTHTTWSIGLLCFFAESVYIIKLQVDYLEESFKDEFLCNLGLMRR